jgi:Flp pilus assembly protein TadG
MNGPRADDAARGVRVRFLADRAGTAILEFALAAPILVVLLLNLFDFSVLIWSTMQTDNSAQMGAQAAFKTCGGGTPPALTNCAGLSTAVTTAAQSTSLSTGVTVASGYPSETFYCTSGTTLQSVGTSPPSPYDCSGATPSDAAATPGDYIVVQVNYSYAPTFPGLSLASAQTLTAKAMQRLQ